MNKRMVALAVLAGCGGGMGDDVGDDGFGDGSFDDPAGFLAFGSSDRAITLAWTPVPGAMGYMLERSDAGDFEPIAALGPQATDYLDVDLTATTYTYRIQAFSDTGISPGLTHTATPTDDPPWTTPDEASAGEPLVQMVGAAGATIVTTDGEATITIPSGAFATDTAVTVQAIANPIPGDPRPGLDVSFGEDFALPVRITFATDEADASDLVMVRKQDDDTWLTQHFDVDAGAGTVTMTLPIDELGGARPAAPSAPSRRRARVLPPLRSTFIAPRFARVGLSGNRTLSPFGLFSQFPCANMDPIDEGFCDVFTPLGQLIRTITAKAITAPLDNMAPGYVRSWSVNGVIGGDTAHGTISGTGVYGGFYTAPAQMPSDCLRPCRVQITFSSRNTATGVAAAETRALIELVPASWTGTIHGSSIAGITTQTEVTWNLDTSSTDTRLTTYKPVATVTPTMLLEDSTVTVNWVYISTTSVLTIDYRQEPPTYSAIGSGSMDVTVVDNVNGGSATFDLALTWMPNITNQPLVSNASEIYGTYDSAVESFDWSFHPGP